MTAPHQTLHRLERRLLAGLCHLLAVLQILDLHSTVRAAVNGRGETNPAILWLIAQVGVVPAVTLLKALALAIVCVYYGVVSNFSRTLWPAISLVPVCAIYVAVVLNNYS